MLGTVHVAFGASAGIGGTVSVPIHLDCLIEDATLDVGGTRVLDAGRFVRMTRLVAVPNVSEGRDEAVLDAIGAAFATHADVLHRSADADHHRAVFFLAGAPGELHLALAAGAAAAAERIDLRRHDGLHPRVGALDVAPVVFLDERAARRGDRRGAARGRRDRRGGHPRLPLRRAGGRAHARRAAQGRPGGARRARHAAGLRPGGAAPDRGRDARLRARAADRLQRRARAARDARRRAPDRRPDPRERGGGAARRARARPAPGAPGRRPGLDQHRGPRRRHRGRRAGRRGGATTRSARPSSWRPRPRPRSPAGPRTSICACRRRSRRSLGALDVSGPWPRPSASAVPSTAATPPAPSRPAAAPAASRPPTSSASAAARRARGARASPSRRGAAPRCAPVSRP